MNFILLFIAFLCLLGTIVSVRNMLKSVNPRKIFVAFVWLGLFVLAIYPDIAQSLTRVLGIGENLNTLIFIGFVFLFFLLVRIFNRVEVLQSNITQLVRAQALDEFRKTVVRKRENT